MTMRFRLALAAMLLGLSGMSAHAAPAAFNLAQYRGKVVYLDFWASWCGPCKQAFPFMAQLSRRYRRADVVVITVNQDRQRAAGEAFLRQVQSTLPVVWDGAGSVAKTWAINELPATLVFDRKGKLRYRHQGFGAGDIAAYEAQIAALVKEH